MALLTPLQLSDAKEAGDCVGLRIERATPVPAGSVNTNYALADEIGQKWFLRVYEEQDAVGAARELRLLDFLATHGVPTPRPCQGRQGLSIFTIRERPAAIFPWMDGSSLHQRDVTPSHMHALGSALSALHEAGASYPELIPNRFAAHRLEERLDTLSIRPDLKTELRDLLGPLRDELSSEAGPIDAPQTIIHGDLFRDNVLWSGEFSPTLLDFESASTGWHGYDLAVVLHAWCFSTEFVPALARGLWAGYANSTKKKGNVPFDALQRALRFAAARFAITRMTDFELRRDVQPVYKDFRRFLLRLSVVRQWSEADIRALFGA